MVSKAELKYFIDVNFFNIIFSVTIWFITNLLWALIIFMSIGIIIGIVAFNSFKSNEYFTYYNLGLTKYKLIRTVFILNFTINFLASFSIIKNL